MNNDNDYAYDMFLQDWHDEFGGLIFGLGEFLVMYNQIEVLAQDLVTKYFEISENKSRQFSENVLGQIPFARIRSILKDIFRSGEREDETQGLWSDLHSLSESRSQIVHQISGMSDFDERVRPHFTRRPRSKSDEELRITASEIDELVKKAADLLVRMSALQIVQDAAETPDE